MERRKTAGIILLVAGIVILVLSLAADALGVGVTPHFGWRQITGAIVGAIAIVVGLIMAFRA
jgi:hypothetical protein